ncbi:unnamed protein product [Schistosoma turkestanicum]|nr:unnamed protein product [Schistosoma turkestanicum]
MHSLFFDIDVIKCYVQFLLLPVIEVQYVDLFAIHEPKLTTEPNSKVSRPKYRSNNNNYNNYNYLQFYSFLEQKLQITNQDKQKPKCPKIINQTSSQVNPVLNCERDFIINSHYRI